MSQSPHNLSNTVSITGNLLELRARRHFIGEKVPCLQKDQPQPRSEVDAGPRRELGDRDTTVEGDFRGETGGCDAPLAACKGKQILDTLFSISLFSPSIYLSVLIACSLSDLLCSSSGY